VALLASPNAPTGRHKMQLNRNHRRLGIGSIGIGLVGHACPVATIRAARYEFSRRSPAFCAGNLANVGLI
jgi:hypothetical protein